MTFTKSVYALSLLIVGLGLAVHSITQAQQIPAVAVVFNGSNANGESTSYGTMSQSFLGGATETNWTIEFWVKNKQPQTDQVLAIKDEYWKYWLIAFPASGQVGFESSWPNTYYSMATTNGVIKSNQWQHVAIVGQGTLGSMYVDGALVYQGYSVAGQLSFNAVVSGNVIAPFVLGFRDNATVADGDWFNGELANFRIWDIALSGVQVASLYSTQPATNAVGLRHWISFNEGAGSTFSDIVGGLQGQLFGTGWTAPPCVPHSATATAIVDRGFVVGATITDGGCGYTNTPVVLIQGGGGSGATATAVVTNGVVVNIIITDAGHDYASVPSLYIYSTVGMQIGLIKAVKPSFSGLIIGTPYQLQISGDLTTWTNQCAAFTATSVNMVYPQYFDVDSWGDLFFRLQTSP